MHDQTTAPGRDGERIDSWSVIHDEVFAGLNHALSNRVMGLESFLTIAERRGTADWSGVMAEQARLERLLQLYRLLEEAPRERPEPMHVSEPAADATDLLGHHLGLRDLVVEGESAPDGAVVSLPRRHAVRAFLVLLYEAARRADPAWGRVSWRYEIGADDVTVMVTTKPALDGEADASLLAEAAEFAGGAPDAVWYLLDPGASFVAALKLPLVRSRRGH
jgi:hypothetical protein